MRFVMLLSVLVAGAWLGLQSCGGKKDAVASVHGQVQQNLDALQSWYDEEWVPLLQNGQQAQLQASFLKGRQLYKKGEWAIEYFFPSTAKDLNGPPVPEVEVAEHLVFPPAGFQVMETFVFPFEESGRTALVQESKKWRSALLRLQTLWTGHQFRAEQVWDAARLQLLRITGLGLANFDTPLSFASLAEIQPSLQGLQSALFVFKNENEDFENLQNAFDRAEAFLRQPHSFDAFDRLGFMRDHMHPLGQQLVQVQKKLQIPFNNIHALQGSVATLFDSAAFDADYFAPGALSYLTDEKVALGKLLFNDVQLSQNNVACASCHHADKAFTDGLPKSRAFGSSPFLHRNTPTLLYAGLQQSQFYDMRAPHLEDQVKNVIDSKDEMHSSLESAVAKLSADARYVQMFHSAFRDTGAITEYKTQAALAAYIRSLAPFASRFDRHMRQGGALSDDEKKGFNLFLGKAKCGSCHFMPLFNGTVPPQFTRTESEVIGVPADKAFTKIDGDAGRYGVYNIEELKGAFKTPTLRNIALTAPYMHNGVYTTLEEVMDFYNKGGAVGHNKALLNQTLPSDSLGLSQVEKEQIILFLHTLTDAR